MSNNPKCKRTRNIKGEGANGGYGVSGWVWTLGRLTSGESSSAMDIDVPLGKQALFR